MKNIAVTTARKAPSIVFILLIWFATSGLLASGVNYDLNNWVINEEGKIGVKGSMFVEGLNQNVSITLTVNAYFIKVKGHTVFACFDDTFIKIASHNGRRVYFDDNEIAQKLFDVVGNSNNPEKLKVFKEAVLAIKPSGSRVSKAKKLFGKLHHHLY